MTELGIDSVLIESIKIGDKTIELRPATPDLLAVEVDDVISIREDFYYEGRILESLSHSLEVVVTQVLYFESFEEALGAVNFEAVLPDASTIDQATKKHLELYGAAQEQEFGVVAFSIEPVLS